MPYTWSSCEALAAVYLLPLGLRASHCSCSLLCCLYRGVRIGYTLGIHFYQTKNKENIEFDFLGKGEESNFDNLIIFGSIFVIIVSMASCAIIIKYRNKKTPLNVKIKKEIKNESSNRAENFELRVQVEKEPIYDIAERPS